MPFGPITILVNNAGGHVILGEPTPFPAADDASWMATLRLDLIAPYELSRLVWNQMAAAGGGAIVNVSSAGTAGLPEHQIARQFTHLPLQGAPPPKDAAPAGPAVTAFAYQAGKGGLEVLTRWLAGVGSSVGIRVNTVRPGLVRTGITSAGDEVPLARWSVPRQIVPRVGEPEEVASAIAFLASDEAAYVTGQLLSVDGGWSGKV